MAGLVRTTGEKVAVRRVGSGQIKMKIGNRLYPTPVVHSALNSRIERDAIEFESVTVAVYSESVELDEWLNVLGGDSERDHVQFSAQGHESCKELIQRIHQRQFASINADIASEAAALLCDIDDLSSGSLGSNLEIHGGVLIGGGPPDGVEVDEDGEADEEEFVIYLLNGTDFKRRRQVFNMSTDEIEVSPFEDASASDLLEDLLDDGNKDRDVIFIPQAETVLEDSRNENIVALNVSRFASLTGALTVKLDGESHLVINRDDLIKWMTRASLGKITKAGVDNPVQKRIENLLDVRDSVTGALEAIRKGLRKLDSTGSLEDADAGSTIKRLYREEDEEEEEQAVPEPKRVSSRHRRNRLKSRVRAARVARRQ